MVSKLAVAAQRHRLALGVFDGGVGLLAAVFDIVGAGLVPRQLCVTALAQTLAFLPKSSALSPLMNAHALEVLELMEEVQTRIDAKLVVATRSAACQNLAWIEQLPFAPSPIANWMTGGLRSRLMNHIRNGAAVLLACSDTLAQQSSVTRILLTHSSQRVETHEFVSNARPQ
jgi:hypothetical protein